MRCFRIHHGGSREGLRNENGLANRQVHQKRWAVVKAEVHRLTPVFHRLTTASPRRTTLPAPTRPKMAESVTPACSEQTEPRPFPQTMVSAGNRNGQTRGDRRSGASDREQPLPYLLHHLLPMPCWWIFTAPQPGTSPAPGQSRQDPQRSARTTDSAAPRARRGIQSPISLSVDMARQHQFAKLIRKLHAEPGLTEESLRDIPSRHQPVLALPRKV